MYIMKINILLPYKEKFDESKASSVSITVKNNLLYSNYLKDIKIFGQKGKNPFLKINFLDLNILFYHLKVEISF